MLINPENLGYLIKKAKIQDFKSRWILFLVLPERSERFLNHSQACQNWKNTRGSWQPDIDEADQPTTRMEYQDLSRKKSKISIFKFWWILVFWHSYNVLKRFLNNSQTFQSYTKHSRRQVSWSRESVFSKWNNKNRRMFSDNSATESLCLRWVTEK